MFKYFIICLIFFCSCKKTDFFEKSEFPDSLEIQLKGVGVIYSINNVLNLEHKYNTEHKLLHVEKEKIKSVVIRRGYGFEKNTISFTVKMNGKRREYSYYPMNASSIYIIND